MLRLYSIAIFNEEVIVAGTTLDSPPIGVGGNVVTTAKFWEKWRLNDVAKWDMMASMLILLRQFLW
ncbi:MAG: hypothetical protein QM734_07600 [Cyclobacteriaceae bacterium]